MISFRQPLQQGFRGADVAALAQGQIEADQASGAIRDGMNFRCPATSAATDSLRVGPFSASIRQIPP
jgi:predicted component of type VI protein secretion system